MKRTVGVVVFVVLAAGVARGQQNNSNNVQNTQSQTATAVGGGNADSVSTAVVGDNTATAQGGSSISYSNATAEGGSGVGWSNSVSEGGIGWSDSDSSAMLVLSTTSITNVKNRTAPLTTYPPYLPIWNHGGWGTIQGYFPNGPATGDNVYQRLFDPSSETDMQELKRMLTSLSYENPIHMLGGAVNGIVALFGGPDNYHHGRGFEIANSLVRDRRPKDKALIVFIDSLIDPQLLKEAGYAYVGRLSLEGKPDRNWDQVYSAAIAETLPWDVDLLLVAGGMKGVTVGSNVSFPTGSVGYAQTNYSLSLFGGYAQGITEGKGEAVLSASAYRFCPELLQRRRVPEALFEKLRRAQPAAAAAAPSQAPVPATPPGRIVAPEPGTRKAGVGVSKELYDMAGLPAGDPATVK
ncbi:MAG: hypothetical protein A2Y77_05875 [Planctomycetes bacterium RBG_13_62_9]|nr:MAG: hypothetical protein A2Y77_05875 [Planctomycetes bacterium RBG_13_62_9]